MSKLFGSSGTVPLLVPWRSGAKGEDGSLLKTKPYALQRGIVTPIVRRNKRLYGSTTRPACCAWLEQGRPF
eukprot:4447331-Amphidinium_carterae.1